MLPPDLERAGAVDQAVGDRGGHELVVAGLDARTGGKGGWRLAKSFSAAHSRSYSERGMVTVSIMVSVSAGMATGCDVKDPEFPRFRP